ncbi:ABC transporter substrate-binding protein [Vibrio ostreicida]|uniref:ABC transporter substrate-binding protein n=1 Tax=Vibrio ostreicida TaxID=526588 RepID=A0ABT8C007_9VIBR|nr:ABC transporter substrate-binding protein [Vibrio ostreicida]MDN3611944.1 ABC transporter substrate-binding protein [Vibrio ostreicida]NPD08876.1 ABC transporter substrate-binding protein [Vibrio ostreicida]
MPVVQPKTIAYGVLCIFVTAFVFMTIISEERETTITKVRVGVTLTPLAAPFLIAERLGLFEQFGLDITLYPCASGISCTQLMLNRDVEYATASESVVMFQSFERNDLALLVSFVESNNDVKLLTLSPSGVEGVRGLEGKRVGVVKGSASEFYFDSVLIINGLKRLNVDKVYLQPHELLPALLSYRVDAISAWEPLGYKADMLSAAPVHNLGTPGIYQQSFNLLSTLSHLEFAGDEARRLLQALDAAVEWINTHPEQALRIITHRLNIPLNQVQWSWQDYVFRLSLGNSLLSNLQLQARWAHESGLVTSDPPDFRDVFFPLPYQQIVALRE